MVCIVKSATVITHYTIYTSILHRGANVMWYVEVGMVSMHYHDNMTPYIGSNIAFLQLRDQGHASQACQCLMKDYYASLLLFLLQ